jgi:IS1 family transposase
MIREEGFAGLFDLRPLNRVICDQEKATSGTSSNIHFYNESPRPQASIWKPISGPWHNAFYGLRHKNHRIFEQTVRAFSEGNGVRGISRIFDIEEKIVLKYLYRAAMQCRRITDLFICNLRVEELQLDEMWSFVRKKEKNMTEAEYKSQLMGDQWCWIALDARTKLIVQYEIGKRTYRLARDLIRHFQQRTDGTLPSLVTSDEYKGYPLALLESYGLPNKGKSKIPPPEMNYAVVSKTRKKGRVVDIKVKVIYGSWEQIQKKLEESSVSKNVNVAFVERCHLSRRQFNRRLTRRTLGFSKKLQNHRWQYELETAIYNFVRPQRSLQYKTPIMAAGKTDHVWSIKELLSYKGEI